MGAPPVQLLKHLRLLQFAVHKVDQLGLQGKSCRVDWSGVRSLVPHSLPAHFHRRPWWPPQKEMLDPCREHRRPPARCSRARCAAHSAAPLGDSLRLGIDQQVLELEGHIGPQPLEARRPGAVSSTVSRKSVDRSVIAHDRRQAVAAERAAAQQPEGLVEKTASNCSVARVKKQTSAASSRLLTSSRTPITRGSSGRRRQRPAAALKGCSCTSSQKPRARQRLRQRVQALLQQRAGEVVQLAHGGVRHRVHAGLAVREQHGHPCHLDRNAQPLTQASRPTRSVPV